MLANHFVENIPNHGFFTLNHLLGSFNGSRKTTQFQLTKDKWLEQLQSHTLGQTTLMQTQSWTNHNYRSARVVNSLAQQILTETTLLAFNHIGERFQRTLVGTSDGATTTTVIQQRIHRFLQHTLFVAHNNIWCAEL